MKQEVNEVECTLLLKTRELLKNDERSIILLSNESGLPFYWLQKLASSSSFKNPSVNKIQKLYEYLSNSKLPV